jgi:hypothetical protein
MRRPTADRGKLKVLPGGPGGAAGPGVPARVCGERPRLDVAGHSITVLLWRRMKSKDAPRLAGVLRARPAGDTGIDPSEAVQ